MREFDIGQVPAGWTRGERLIVREATARARGCVMQDPAAMFAGGPGQTPDGTQIGMVVFDVSDKGRVATWLQWWNATAKDNP